LLDLTDNLKGTEVIPPEKTVRYDEDDPYLVVAADKGTATFSDIANSISQEYDFWLGDAFASGGSMGYDHKKMGITARGAWESVRRHFRELGIDPDATDFTATGIGDMAGDVFGNGLLLSKHIRLVAAFNHMHIFLDPNPDSTKSYEERKRLFELPRSSWTDYNANLISTGGGVYLRSAKSIPLSPEVKQLLDLDVDNIVPNDLIRAILKARVDLLWNGGIGTYVKAITERHNEVGDRSNDAIRINGNELRCKAVGEGGNLGFTQLGRVEYSLNNGLIYTDFIDNSAGVDCSDHEVNIKILLNGIVTNGDMTLKQRNVLLADMTDEIAALVLQDNYYQTQAISHAAAQAEANLDLFSRYMDGQERAGRLPIALEFLPDSKAIVERKVMGKGLTRPELAVLLSYCKMNLKADILSCDLPEDPSLASNVEFAFPVSLRKKFRTQMDGHSLRREIIATQLSNSMINHMGITFVHRLQDETGAPISAVVRAYTVAKEVFDMEPLMTLVESLDYKVPSDMQVKMTTRIVRLIRRATRWFLRNRRAHLDIENTIEHFRGGVAQLYDRLPGLITGAAAEKFEELAHELREAGVPEGIARKIAITREMFSVLDIIESATENQLDLDRVASVYFALDERLELGWLRDQFSSHEVNDHWDALARAGLRDDLDWQQRGLTVGVLQTTTGHKTIEAHIDAWIKQHQPLVDRCQSMLANLRSCSVLEFLMFSVAVRELMDLTQASLQAAAQAKPDRKRVS
jgi:glutamate dehydrogenase